MKTKTILVLFLLLLPVFSFAQSTAELDKADFLKAVADYYEVDQNLINKIVESGIDYSDIPVVLYVSKNTQMDPEKIIELRKSGQSWETIMKGRNFPLDKLYFLISGKINSKKFKPIFDKFPAYNPKAVTPIVLSDQEISEIVNLRFLFKFYDYSVFEIMAMRDYGKNYVRINADIKMIKEELKKQSKIKEREEAKKKKEAEKTSDG